MKTILPFFFFLFGFFANGQVPNFEWASKIGAGESFYNIVQSVDAQGNSYHSGYFSTTADFDPGTAVITLNQATGRFYVTKRNPQGTVLWAHNFPAASSDYSIFLSVAVSDGVIVSGRFSGIIDADPGVGTTMLTATGTTSDIFITKLDQDGNFVWAKQFGNENYESTMAIATDQDDNLYLTGRYAGIVDFNPGTEIFNLTGTGTNPAVGSRYILKLNNDGDFVWSVDTGWTSSLNFDAPGALKVTNSGSVLYAGTFIPVGDEVAFPDIIIFKLNPDGSTDWSKQIGGSSVDYASGLDIDSQGNVVVSGAFFNTVDFDPGTGISNLSAQDDIDTFVMKLDSDGNLVWVKQFVGSDGNTNANGLVIDAADNIYLTGKFFGTMDADPGTETVLFSDYTNFCGFLVNLNSDGEYLWGQKYANTYSQATDVDLDPDGSLYIAGSFTGTFDFDPTAATNNLTASIATPFVQKLIPSALALHENKASALELFPNPSRGKVFIQASTTWIGSSVSVSNILGQSVKSFELSNAITSETLEKGIYFFTFSNIDSVVVKKIIVQ